MLQLFLSPCVAEEKEGQKMSSSSRRFRRQQERAMKGTGCDRITKTPLPHLTENEFGVIRAEVEHYRQEAYTQGCNDGYSAGYDRGFDEGDIAGIKEGYTQGWNDAYNKMSLDIINSVVAIALKVCRDDWGKFAFKKKEERPKCFGDVLAMRFEEYFGDGLDDPARREELKEIMKQVGFYYAPLGGKLNGKSS